MMAAVGMLVMVVMLPGAPGRVTALVERTNAVQRDAVEPVLAGVEAAVADAGLGWHPPPQQSLPELMRGAQCKRLDQACVQRIILPLGVEQVVWVTARSNGVDLQVMRARSSRPPARQALAWLPSQTLAGRARDATAVLLAETAATAPPPAVPQRGVKARAGRLSWWMAAAALAAGALGLAVVPLGLNATVWGVHTLVWARSRPEVALPMEGLVGHGSFLAWQKAAIPVLVVTGVMGAGLALGAGACLAVAAAFGVMGFQQEAA